MNEGPPFLILERSCDEAVEWLARRMSAAGLRVVRTFDLHVARHTQPGSSCPHHGVQPCDCQMVVLLVYAGEASFSAGHRSVSVVAQGNNGQTSFSVVDTPQQRADPLLEASIRRALIPSSFLPAGQENGPQAT